MRRPRALPAVLALLLMAGPGAVGLAAEVEVVTYVPSPDSDYKDLSVKESLTLGSAGAGSGQLRGNNADGQPEVLAVKNNQIGAWNTSTSHGGHVHVGDTLSVENTGGQNLFYVDSATNRVGVGTNAPRAALEVVGYAKGMIVTAHYDTVDWTFPWADMYAQVNTVDNTDSSLTNALGARFAATYRPADYRFCTMHIDASPLVLQTINKAGISLGQGKGQVVIRGVQITTDNDLILIVGESAGDYGGVNPVCRANAWNSLASSAAFKSDIRPLTATDLDAISRTLESTPVYSYLYKTENEAQRRHTGFLAEEAPQEMVSGDRSRIDLGEQMGYLLAAAKAESLRLDALESRSAALEGRANA